ncbi:HlyD family secretion protein [Moheibacter lacus]|uniref:HlyD family efflux transporter periplasmic adaptor subunit n=1 Tax=Moheibacter lacus TaxID=2745851 RepID=A0A838ZNG7_9FLAO|nr:HlyD family efflux transporter periplasmic adaptor subunit [Moheibacter lacus]MBA5629236.1 HlyD family efflux transporter periplasmic adaptor subunit [Moheibacter lacus]
MMEESSKVYDIRKRSDFVNDILNKTPSWILSWGNTFFLIFLLLLIFLTWFIKYPDVVRCEAEVTSEAPPIKLVSRTTGKIDSIFLKNNSLVKKGDWLLIINTKASIPDILELEKKLKYLNENISDVDKVFSVDFNYLDVGELQPSYNNFLRLIKKYRSYSTDNNYGNQSSINQSRISNLMSSISNLRNQKEIAFEEMQVSKLNLDRQKKMLEKGIVTKADYEISQSQYLQYQRQVQQYDNQIFQIQQDIELIRSNLQTLKQTDKDTHQDYDIDIANSIKEMTKSFEDWANTYALRASRDGKIQYLDDIYQNKFINIDSNLLSIINESEDKHTYRVTLKMPTNNSGKVKEGQLVNIKLNNYPYEEFGVLQGKVKAISEVVNEDYYFVEASLPNGLKTTYKKEIEPKNLIGTAEIITDDLRLTERFLHLLTKNFKN